MQRMIDVKSVLLGAALGVLTMACFGAAAHQGPQVGRFAIEGNPGHVFVLDTATGQVWQSFTPPTSGEETPGFSSPKLPRLKAP
jgi:hypothetical protein